MATKLVPLAAAAALVLSAGLSAAQDTVKREVTGPNRALLRSGVGVLVVSYVPALAVAATSERDADEYLYAPVAGPWLDLSKRDCDGCDNESLYKGLLVTDGIFQGIGALQIASAFLFMETREERRVARVELETSGGATLSLRPARLPRGYGLVATGQF